MKKVRQPAVAGYFYTSDRIALKEEIEKYLFETKPNEVFDRISGIVVPHAGYKYSGRIAAAAYNTIKGKKIETAVILSPSHREYFRGICIYEGDSYLTPLGEAPVNTELRELILQKKGPVFKGSQGHNAEHAVEVQIPFFQTIFENIKILPVVIGEQSEENIYEISSRLAEIADDSIIVAASSDLSHFYPKVKAAEKDSLVEKYIRNMDYSGMQECLEASICEACGGGCITALMRYSRFRKINKSKILARGDSGDISGDNREVVGYLSAVFYE